MRVRSSDALSKSNTSRHPMPIPSQIHAIAIIIIIRPLDRPRIDRSFQPGRRLDFGLGLSLSPLYQQARFNTDPIRISPLPNRVIGSSLDRRAAAAARSNPPRRRRFPQSSPTATAHCASHAASRLSRSRAAPRRRRRASHSMTVPRSRSCSVLRTSL